MFTFTNPKTPRNGTPDGCTHKTYLRIGLCWRGRHLCVAHLTKLSLREVGDRVMVGARFTRPVGLILSLAQVAARRRLAPYAVAVGRRLGSYQSRDDLRVHVWRNLLQNKQCVSSDKSQHRKRGARYGALAVGSCGAGPKGGRAGGTVR